MSGSANCSHMKISGFTFLRNGQKLGYPFVKSIRSALGEGELDYDLACYAREFMVKMRDVMCPYFRDRSAQSFDLPLVCRLLV